MRDADGTLDMFARYEWHMKSNFKALKKYKKFDDMKKGKLKG